MSDHGCCSCCHSHDHHDHHDHHEEGHHHHEERNAIIRSLISLLMLGLAIWWDYSAFEWWSSHTHTVVRLGWYLVSYLLVAYPVILSALEAFRHRENPFNEFFLMSIASIGAFYIGAYHEAILLMILYTIGEMLQDKAAESAHHSIVELIDNRSEEVHRLIGDREELIPSKSCQVGDLLQLRTGERLALDCKLISDHAVMDLSALTGETMLVDLSKGDSIPAGAIVSQHPIKVEVVKPYDQSTLAHIINMVEEAGERKPETERFIRKFAKIYTPIVTLLAVLIIFLPYLYSLISHSYTYSFDSCCYRGLVFLVTSCPCALIISIPLGYFGGVGAASRRGLLFKGTLFLDKLCHVNSILFDKTGTMTEGRFEVEQEHLLSGDRQELLGLILSMESGSTHPIAEAVCRYIKKEGIAPTHQDLIPTEEAGYGLTAHLQSGERVIIGGAKMMMKYGIQIPQAPQGLSLLYLAIDAECKIYLSLADQVKESAYSTIRDLHEREISPLIMLSGDSKGTVERVASAIGVDEAYGELLPQDKMAHLERIMSSHTTAFVGDGLNDAPVMARCDVGFAMGGIGSDATIEAADVVIQSDDPHKVVEAVDISKHTRNIVLQNIIFALSFKFIVMILALFGIATLTMAILADVGVSLLSILNSMRALRYTPRSGMVQE